MIIFRRYRADGQESGRVDYFDGTLRAHVRRESDGEQVEANAEQAADLFHDALLVSLLRKDDDVIAWNPEHKRHQACRYVQHDDHWHIVHAQGQPERQFRTVYAVPVEVAMKEGCWPFSKGTPLYAVVEGTKRLALFQTYEKATGQFLVKVMGFERLMRFDLADLSPLAD